jgi:hypothetical protein
MPTHAGPSVGVPASEGGGNRPHTPDVAPVALRQVRPEQHSPVAVQVPFAPAHVVPPSGGGGGGGGGAAVQVPASCPAISEHVPPAQQSLDDVQVPARFTHFAAEQRSVPFASGRQGDPPQHSDENVHWAPAAMQHGAVPV